MKRIAALSAAVFTCWLATAADAPRRTAVVKADRTNIRARPAFDGEVLATLRKGETVIVLDEVPGTGADGAPRAWSKIKMPSTVGVWVYGYLVDKAASSIKAEYANFRAGPGRNYSELGRLPRGASIAVVRELDDWLQIEPPPAAVAYVASSLLAPAEPAESKPLAAAKPVEAAVAPPSTVISRPKAGADATPPEVRIVAAERIPQPKAPAMSPAPIAAPVAVQVPETPRPAAAALTSISEAPLDILTNALRQAVEKPPQARVVLRQGIIRATANIQSPGYYELWSTRGEGLLDYLVTDDPALVLARYAKRPVYVRGEEWRDERWKTPLIKVSSVEPAN